MSVTEILIPAILVAAFVGMNLLARRSEKIAWNGGHCPRCKTRWHHFDNDSQGGRGYRCSGCLQTNHIWISWPKVDRYAL